MERNYDIGDRELLAVKLALTEWRHWLEGTKEPFLVWTDHKNLESIGSTKCLNSRQARWSLFFSWFNFRPSYWPGSKNGKPDTLSRRFKVSDPATPYSILPPQCLLGLVSWDIERIVLAAQSGESAPSACPPNCLLFLGPSVRRFFGGATLPSWPANQGQAHGGSHQTTLLVASNRLYTITIFWPITNQ